MTIRSVFPWVATLLVLGSATASAQRDASSLAPPPLFPDPDRVGKLSQAFPAIDRVMRDFAERARVPGIAYGIVIDGRLAHRGTAGFRELASRAPVDSSSVFRIASMSKSFAALAILQLRDEGKLSLEDPAERYVPELATLRYPTTDSPRITIRHLLSHSGGFPEDNPWGDQQLALPDDEMNRLMRSGIPFSTAPGTAYEYSNYGYAILGRIVANVSGMSFARYLDQKILAPLGMMVTTLEARTVSPARLAHGYRWQDTTWLEEAQLADGAFGPMGGMLTSIDDLSRWVGFMLDAWPPRDGSERGPVRRASVREMQQVARYNGASTVRNPTTGAVTLSAGGYGYGLGVRQSCQVPSSVAHSGGLPGFGSIMQWLPDYGVGIVTLGNLTYTGWRGPVEQAFELLEKTGGLIRRVPQPAPVLVQAREQVTRLVLNWTNPLADSIAAMNLYLDEPKLRRRAAIERVRAQVGGGCRSEGDFEVENALRGRWRLRCASGDIRVSITLAPTEPAKVQQLDVRTMSREESLAPPATCR